MASQSSTYFVEILVIGPFAVPSSRIPIIVVLLGPSGMYIRSTMSFYVYACARDWRDLRWPINFDPVPETESITHAATMLRYNNFSRHNSFVRARIHFTISFHDAAYTCYKQR